MLAIFCTTASAIVVLPSGLCNAEGTAIPEDAAEDEDS